MYSGYGECFEGQEQGYLPSTPDPSAARWGLPFSERSEFYDRAQLYGERDIYEETFWIDLGE